MNIIEYTMLLWFCVIVIILIFLVVFSIVTKEYDKWKKENGINEN